MSENKQKIINIILAILVSLGAWTYVVYNNDPMTEVRYKDVPITFEGEDALANNGLGVSQVSTDSIDVTLRQRRIDTNSITANDIDVVADVSAAAEGENGISLQISGPDGTQIAAVSRRSIAVEVETTDTVESKIYVEYSSEVPGSEPVITSLTSSQATVIGAQSEAARVDRVAALLSYDDTRNRPKKFTVSLSALDEDGDVIDHLVIYPREVNFIAYSGITKEVPLKIVTEDPDDTSDEDQNDEEDQGDGYTRTYTAPDTIMIKGSPEVLANVNEISTDFIDINSFYDDEVVDLTYALPDGVFLANASHGLTMRVSVKQKTTEENE